MKRIILGTAGHVDHGKTRLIKALTGKDTDRLAEEKRRGITIELGFAPLRLSSELMAGIIDVPGHEKFVRTMISGASGVDAIILVVAADEGIKMQTREHLDICRLLGIEHGVCVLTKVDLASPELVNQRVEEIRKYVKTTLRHSPEIIPVSVETGSGLEDLTNALDHLTSRLSSPQTDGRLCFPIDRLFSKAGMGTIVTGTLSGASLSTGENLLVLPDELPVSVRSLQIFDEGIRQATPRTRLAINLTGVSRDLLHRGQTLCRPGELQPTQKFHVALSWLPEDPSPLRRSLRILCGTQDLPGKVVGLGSDKQPILGEIRLRQKIVVRAGDRFIIRAESPRRTLGGGKVVDPHPSTRLSRARLDQTAHQSPRERLLSWIEMSAKSITLTDLGQRLSLQTSTLLSILEPHLKSGKITHLGSERYIASDQMRKVKKNFEELVQDKKDIPLAEIITDPRLSPDQTLNQFVLRQLTEQKVVTLSKGRVRLTSLPQAEVHPAVALIDQGEFTPPTAEELGNRLGEKLPSLKKRLAHEADEGRLVRVSDSLYYSTHSIEKLGAICLR